ncbi:helix-turn-helix domain-containing protein [Desertivirga arenae]|uniref:helix-turn-helix domain-containing protein n=1 Tax=Desertivirga arenae TaxID=2810309 RepID=UPI001A975C20|nr:helix-turn-helix domain-containing protein [Pedobacter sp. SYSU D00823]
MHDLTRLIKIIYALKTDFESVRNDVHIIMEWSRKHVSLAPPESQSTAKVHWITAQAAAELIHTSRKTIEAYSRDGKIKREMVNGLWHYLESDVLKYDKGR